MCSCVFAVAYVVGAGNIETLVLLFFTKSVQVKSVQVTGKGRFRIFRFFRITVIPTLFPLAVCCIFCSAGCTLPAQTVPSPTAKDTV